ncbi:MAG TPA: DUF3891 family protein [Gemmatimonadota bacterium]|nr:DUF3891 family protein [Gemmatimonadota bacterium]
MITHETSEGLLCIHQIDHARLAGRLAEWWGGGAVPSFEPPGPVLTAIRNHDAGWAELDAEPVWDPRTGRPHTYRTHALPETLDVAERSVSRVASIEPYAGWLVGRHFASFYEKHSEPAAKDWVAVQAARQAELFALAAERWPAGSLAPRVLEANFDWLQLLDALSLAVAHDWEVWEGRPMARDYQGSIGTFRYRRDPRSRSRRVMGRVTPYPFTPPRLAERLPARVLPGLRWIGPDPLLQAWREARSVTVEVVLMAG